MVALLSNQANMDMVDIAWLAGLVEGEGTIVLPSAYPNSVALTVFMTDQDVLLHALDVTEAGSVRGPYFDKRPGSKRKPIYKWSVTGRQEVARILLAIYPLMGERRKQRIADATMRLANNRARMRWFCSKGHANWRIDAKGNRTCRDCSREKLRRWRAAQKEKDENNG
ncbi:MAG: hypothetical protein LC792_08815 [Actinobacteria bacterium]|nr:hypothetical protein [Actinomycetota bacterium]